MENNGFELGLYDMNKQIIAQLPDLTDWDRVEETLKNFDIDWHNKYYMLYGKEIGYFTLFMRDSYNWEIESLDLAVMECLINVGPIYSIELTAGKDAIEIWVKDTQQDLLTCMYLFPYDNGIVRIK